MSTPRVVPAFDEVEDGAARVGLTPRALAIDDLAPELREEALAHGVLVAIAHTAHRRPDAGLATAPAEGERRVLAALIRVMNHLGRSALRDGHVERGQDELGAEVGFHRPADDPATPRVEHDGEIQEAGPRRDVRDVRDPQPIGAGRRELAVDEIRGRPRRLVAHRRVERFPTAHALHAGGPHEPGDALAADLEAARREFSVDAWCAVRAARHPVNRVDVRRQLHIGPRPRRQRALPPRVVPAGGDTQHAAHGGDLMDGLVCGHELESLDGIVLVSRANQAAAFERIARSSRSCRFSRRSRRSSSCSSVVRPSVRSPASRAACFTQFRIAWAEGSNSRPSSSGVRPCRTNSIICRRNAGGYARWLFGIVDAPFRPNHGVSTKPGQLQGSYPLPRRTVVTSRTLHVRDVPGSIGKAPAPLGAVVFVHYNPDASRPAIRRLTTAEAGARLYANALNPLAHARDGLDGAVRITAARPCYELVSADLSATSALLVQTAVA